jgi:hypothetical protein
MPMWLLFIHSLVTAVLYRDITYQRLLQSCLFGSRCLVTGLHAKIFINNVSSAEISSKIDVNSFSSSVTFIIANLEWLHNLFGEEFLWNSLAVYCLQLLWCQSSVLIYRRFQNCGIAMTNSTLSQLWPGSCLSRDYIFELHSKFQQRRALKDEFFQFKLTNSTLSHLWPGTCFHREHISKLNSKFEQWSPLKD